MTSQHILAYFVHVMAAVIWVGGMFFAMHAVHPAAKDLPIAERSTFLCKMLSKFFLYVWISIVMLLGSGYWMIFQVFGGMKKSGQSNVYIHVMQGSGLLMMFLFLFIYFSPYQALKHFVANKQYEEAAGKLKTIRICIMINMTLGILTILIAVGRNTLLGL